MKCKSGCCCHDTILGFLAADVKSTAAVTLGPRPPTLVGGVAVLTGAAVGTTLTSHLLLRFFGSSPKRRRKKEGNSQFENDARLRQLLFFPTLICFRAVLKQRWS